MTTLKSKLSYSRRKARKKVKALDRFRELSCTQIVHHVDEDSFNNDFDNLTIMSSGEHSSLHWLLNPERKGGRLKSIKDRLKELEKALILYHFSLYHQTI